MLHYTHLEREREGGERGVELWTEQTRIILLSVQRLASPVPGHVIRDSSDHSKFATLLIRGFERIKRDAGRFVVE